MKPCQTCFALISHHSANQDIRFPAGSTLHELYVRGTGCTIVDLTDCASLTSLGINYISGYQLQSLSLPTSLERLCLYNVLRAGLHPELCLLNNTGAFQGRDMGSSRRHHATQIASFVAQARPTGLFPNRLSDRPADATDQAEEVGHVITAQPQASGYHRATAPVAAYSRDSRYGTLLSSSVYTVTTQSWTSVPSLSCCFSPLWVSTHMHILM